MITIRYHSDQGAYVALLVGRGPKFVRIIPMDSGGIRIKKVPAKNERFMREVDYPEKRAARKFLAAGKRYGISREARAVLRGVL